MDRQAGRQTNTMAREVDDVQRERDRHPYKRRKIRIRKQRGEKIEQKDRIQTEQEPWSTQIVVKGETCIQEVVSSNSDTR